ncbi:hypothetical protein ACJJTC_019711 [Scirpophaga incertulas]
MSGAERARWFRERRKAAAEKNANSARNFSAAADLASTSTTGIPVLMDVTNEQTIDISIESATELRDVNISRSEAMENHWRSADNRFKTVFEANPMLLGLPCFCSASGMLKIVERRKNGLVVLFGVGAGQEGQLVLAKKDSWCWPRRTVGAGQEGQLVLAKKDSLILALMLAKVGL